MNRIGRIIACMLLGWGMTHAQEGLRNPMDFPISLSGNFGELRANHFHSGIDLKTQQVEGKPVYAVEDGYVSRIGVSPWGFGNVLYLVHPAGIKTVYGHLQRFSDEMARYVKEQQYAKEDFPVDINLPPETFPVKKGQLIGFAGNSGGSGGPHLHFEVRDAETDNVIDPLRYYKNQIKDTRPPKIESFMLYPQPGKGAINGSAQKLELKFRTNKDGSQTLSPKAEAWGEVGIAVKAYDYMDGTTNIYGVSRIAMAVDGEVVFSSHIDSFSIGKDTRYINSFTDIEEWRDRRSFYMKSFIEPGNRLLSLQALDRGVVRIDEERPYRITYLLKDAYGNQTKHTFQIDGKRQAIQEPDTAGREYFHWKGENRFGAKGIRLAIPDGNLYEGIHFRYSAGEEPFALAAVHHLHDRYVPLHNNARLSLRLRTDTLEDKKKYGIVRLQGRRAVWIGGDYRSEGWLDADIRELGSYTVMHDLTPPAITPVNPKTWLTARRISLRISDNLSGVQTYRGEIDGQYVLFELDGKKALATYTFDSSRLKKGAHRLTFTVTDACGNRSVYDYSFTW